MHFSNLGQVIFEPAGTIDKEYPRTMLGYSFEIWFTRFSSHVGSHTTGFEHRTAFCQFQATGLPRHNERRQVKLS